MKTTLKIRTISIEAEGSPRAIKAALDSLAQVAGSLTAAAVAAMPYSNTNIGASRRGRRAIKPVDGKCVKQPHSRKAGDTGRRQQSGNSD